MRRVYDDTDFEDETAWCAQCGTPLGPSSAYYNCEAYDCDAILCEGCEGSSDGGCYCPRHRGNGALLASKETEYTYPYTFRNGKQFTFVVEVEMESELYTDFVAAVTESSLIAGWDSDPSLEAGGVELQTNILDMSKLPALVRLVERIPDYGENAGATSTLHALPTSAQAAGIGRCEDSTERNESDSTCATCSIITGANSIMESTPASIRQ